MRDPNRENGRSGRRDDREEEARRTVALLDAVAREAERIGRPWPEPLLSREEG